MNKLVFNNCEKNEFIDMCSISKTQIIFNNLEKKLLECLSLKCSNISKKSNIFHGTRSYLHERAFSTPITVEITRSRTRLKHSECNARTK